MVDSLAASNISTPKIQTPTTDQVLTITGFPDVTNRRTNVVSLSTLGWYRAIMIATAWRGGRSFAVDICIGRTYANTKNEIHRITLLANWDSFAFVDEISKSDTNIISGIRYTHDSNNGYIDIQYSSLSENGVYVDFAVHCHPGNMANCTAQSLQSVADSPSGETVLTEYAFSNNAVAGIVIDERTVTTTAGGYYLFSDYPRSSYTILSVAPLSPADAFARITGASVGQYVRVMDSGGSALGSTSVKLRTVFITNTN